jgi:hypothetical protein
MRFTMSAAAGALLLAACMTNDPVRHELVGKPLRVEFATGDVGTVLLRSDGTTTFNDGQQTFRGSWRAEGAGICLSYQKMLLMDNECFTYPAPLRQGVKTTFRSAGGETVWVTIV